MIRDVMQSAGLAGFAEFGVIVFVLAFAMILINALFGLDDSTRTRLAEMPLAPDDVVGDDEPTPDPGSVIQGGA